MFTKEKVEYPQRVQNRHTLQVLGKAQVRHSLVEQHMVAF